MESGEEEPVEQEADVEQETDDEQQVEPSEQTAEAEHEIEAEHEAEEYREVDTDTAAKPKTKKLKLPDFTFFKSKTLVSTAIIIISILAIMYIAIYVRSGTLDSPTVLDYDPWWFYRHAKELIENNMQMPVWDELSHFPPGRPYEPYQGWAYTIAIFQKILGPLLAFTLTETAKWSTLIMAAFAVVPAFLLGRLLSNKWGGLCVAIFGVLAPTLIGVSMAGYCDSDMVVVFYTFLSIYSILLAMKKKVSLKSMPYYIFAILVNLAFVFTWGYGWIILLFFTAFIPALFIFRIIEQIFHKRSFRISLTELKGETKIILPLLIVIIVTNIIGYFLNLGNIIVTFILGFAFTQGQLLLVNISVAELQQTSIFVQSGFNSIVDRVGLGPTLFTIGVWPVPIITSPLILFMLFKLYKKKKINPAEIFLFLLSFATFYLISWGVRFSLLFSTAAAITTGYIVGNIPKYLNKKILKVTLFGFVAVLVLMFVSNAISVGYGTGGMRISGNWYDMLDWINEETDPKALIVTWWDPGHIIAGYTGHRVMADGAHCGPGLGGCIPYSHDIRIQDMGRVFSISDEEEAIPILEKYKELTPEQCAEARETYGTLVPADACGPVPEMYIIASSDLISKYYWLSYFGTGTGRNYFQLSISDYDEAQGVISYGGGQVSLVYENGIWIPILNFPNQGIRNVIVKEILYFENGQPKHLVSNETEVIDGMVWVDPGYGTVIFMDAAIRDSLFTQMFFFNGEGLEHFDLVYQNLEIRLFKVIW